MLTNTPDPYDLPHDRPQAHRHNNGHQREWRNEEGWGVLASPDTPGGCWVHFSHLDMTGYRALTPAQVVRLDWESPGQDGYDYRTIRVTL